MTGPIRPDGDERPVPESVKWFVRSLEDTSMLPPAERADWEAWSSDPFHAAQFRRTQQLWARLGEPEVRELLMDRERRGSGDRVLSPWLTSRRSLSIAACVTLICAFGAFNYWTHFQRRLPDARIYVTEPAVTKILDLSDGSRLVLGAGSRLSVDYTPSHRLIRLDRGEALFVVAHDRNRPFVVLAGSGRITAVGTQFDVRREADETDRVVVTVSEGAVEVVHPAKSDPDRAPHPASPARLVKGQAMIYDRSGTTPDMSLVDPVAATAWVEGRLEYQDTPLRFVVQRVSRYSRKRISISDDGVGNLPFTGVVFTDQVDEWLRALPSVYSLDVHEQADQILISSRPESSVN